MWVCDPRIQHDSALTHRNLDVTELQINFSDLKAEKSRVTIKDYSQGTEMGL